MIPRRRGARLVLAALVMVVALAVVVAETVSPPRLLSWADAAVGGGWGAEQAASAVPFGSEGQTLDVWRPTAAAASGSLPVLIFFYGGGWVNGDRAAYAFAARAFAEAGFVVVVPDYRKVPGVRFPAFVQDGAQAVRWTRDHVARFGGDPRRIALAGHSAGAYNAIMLALDPRWLRAEGVNPRIVRAAIGLCGPYDFYPFDKKRSIDAMQGVASPELTQPIYFARADAPPLLLVTASHDTEVRPYNAVNLYRRLRRVGAPVMFRDYAGLTHEQVAMALSWPFRGKAPVLADSVGFLNRILAPGRQRGGR
jgi:acetyl esterase/lipase